ncbi:MAG: YidC/Oxa1 family membrane protein insertase [Firmicutes bacterium]|nr:YidC/Oxa1 family membrane protein insertase [Bacillota bacterium]
MTWLLNWLYSLTVAVGVPNYGIAIILLTVLIKIALYPLSHKQMRSMLAMQQLQPKIKEIQDKYKAKDPQKMQQMIMELYKEHNVNPMAGCLPLLVQMPILIALYRSLYNFPYVNEAHASFLWVHSLSQHDPYYIFPVLAGVTTYLQSKLTTSMADPTQKTMLYTMPVFIAWIASTVPSGLGLYWVVFNVVGTIQQYFINKSAAAIREGMADGESNRKNR